MNPKGHKYVTYSDGTPCPGSGANYTVTQEAHPVAEQPGSHARGFDVWASLRREGK